MASAVAAAASHRHIALLMFLFCSASIAGGAEVASLDLLDALQLHNSSRPGVSPASGPQRHRPAFYLQGDFRDLRLPPSEFHKAVALLKHNTEFTLAALLRQEEANSGTIISFSHGVNRYLELQSSGRKDEIRLHYSTPVSTPAPATMMTSPPPPLLSSTTSSGTFTTSAMPSSALTSPSSPSESSPSVRVETFPFRLADGEWHSVALTVSGAQLQLLVDCHPLYRRLLPFPLDTTFSPPQLQLWVGQRNNKHSLFKGALQDVRLIPGPHGYLRQCPQLDTTCPTCGQFGQLQNVVDELTNRLQSLADRLTATENRLAAAEECDCQKSCRINGSLHADGSTWQRECNMCSCIQGSIQCRPLQCPPITCKNPVINPNECCPSCLKQCLLHGVLYDHGESANLRQCVECQCRDGSMHCNRIDPATMCPQLTCPPEEQFSVPGECCKFCPGVDYCAKGHLCHKNASCLNLQTTYTCHCDMGFSGDGHTCTDVDECISAGGLNGHHCHSNTRCVNTVGSYVCDCLTGYRRVDKFNCAEVDECATGLHRCSAQADCINTAGSYHCRCRDGYQGDGYTCQPVCNTTCLNGGWCSAPGRCTCRPGYMGGSCELDLDECASGTHRCPLDAARCVNMPGWYYCRCRPGYRAALPVFPALPGPGVEATAASSICTDIDECAEGSHTCHSSTRCVNTEGGFRCECSPGTEDCRLSCMIDGLEIADGTTAPRPGRPCERCQCSAGVLTCRPPTCDCSQPHSRACCPQCDSAASCRHQELHHVVFRSGERWIFQCQTCECLYGEVDCWPMECPPTPCATPVLAPGDCCARCEDDPCASVATPPSSVNTTSSVGEPCLYAGHLYESGAHWADPHDKCAACNCKDGHLCCSFDYRCITGPDTTTIGGRTEVGSTEATSSGTVAPLFSSSENSNAATSATVTSPFTVTSPRTTSSASFVSPLFRGTPETTVREVTSAASTLATVASTVATTPTPSINSTAGQQSTESATSAAGG